MAASYITVPVELNRLRASDHSFDSIDIAAEMQYEAGENRRRRIYTQVPDIVNFSWDMTQAHLDIYDNWFEEDLIAGERQFDILVAQEGGTGVTWSNAKFIGVPEIETLPTGDYVVSGQMLLLGDRFDVRVAPSLQGKATIRFSSIATLAPIDTLTVTALIQFSTRAMFDLGEAGKLHGDAAISFTGNADLDRIFRATMGGDVRVTMDGNTRAIL